MNIILKGSYQSEHSRKIIEVFTSPEMPTRPSSVKELASIVYADRKGYHVIFIFEVPDDQLSAFFEAQGKRTAFMAARTEGLTIDMQVGQPIGEGIQTFMGQLPT